MTYSSSTLKDMYEILMLWRGFVRDAVILVTDAWQEQGMENLAQLSSRHAVDKVRVKLDTGMERKKKDMWSNARAVCLVEENKAFCYESTHWEAAR